MQLQPNISSVAFLIADAARASMLLALINGKALPAGELAEIAGITAQTASAHLAKLLAGGLLSCETQGRHRYYRLAGDHVAHVIEQLAAISPPLPARRMQLSRETQVLRFARCCYDHLAGRLGVAITLALQERGYIMIDTDKRYRISDAGTQWFATMGIDAGSLRPGKNGVARQCLDWTERTHHLAGPLGNALLKNLCAVGWLQRSSSSRSIQVTPVGWRELKKHLNIDETAIAEILGQAA